MAIVTTNSENYTNIANAIRTSTGSSSTLTPENMPDAITGFNVRKYTVTIPSDITTGTVTLAQDDWLKNNRSNSNLIAALYCTTSVQGASGENGTILAGVCGNTPYMITSGAVKKHNINMILSNGGYSTRHTNTNGLKGGLDVGYFIINTSGQFQVYGNSSYPIKAGTYSIIAWLS